MAIPGLVRRAAEKQVAAFCQSRVPAHLHDKIRLEHRIRGNSVTISENRPLLSGTDRWTSVVVAQFRYDSSEKEWTLWSSDRNSRWHRYWDADPAPTVESLLEEVDEDPTAIFWG